MLSSMKSFLLCLTILVIFSNKLIAQKTTKNLYIEFDGSIVNNGSINFEKSLLQQYPEFDQLFLELEMNYQLEPIMNLSSLERLDRDAQKIGNSSKAISSLKNTFKLKLENANDETLEEVVAQLSELKKVTKHYFANLKVIQPPIDFPPVTTDFLPEQTYLNAVPGVNMTYAWDLGILGQNVNVRDIEYGVNINHEELHEKNIFVAPGMTVYGELGEDFTEHGTAAMGVVISDHGNYGISGMQHQIEEMILFPEYTEENDYDRIYAIAQSIAASEAGDIIMYEMQTYGEDDEYVPAEFEYLVWELTKAATDAGIIIVAAAGNGDQNLDNPFYDEYNSRENSGAIIVGAGSANTIHSKLGFSTYGTRVDVQGWGTNVIAPGYGYDYQFGGDFNQNYIYFSGTSSATPIVASCAIALQSYYFGLTSEYLTSQEIRTILKETGTPQGGDLSKPIGPLPNMQTAIQRVNSLNLEQLNEDSFSLFPNPAKDIITVIARAENSTDEIMITNSIGQQVLSQTAQAINELSISDFEAGVYFIKIGNSKVKKFVKI